MRGEAPGRKRLAAVSRPADPPAPLDAEEAVLGAVMIAGRLLPEIAEQVTADDFYRPAHRTVFAAMTTLHDRGEPLDVITVRNELRRQRVLDDLGGALFLHSLMEYVPTVAHAPAYAREVARAAQRRRLMDLGTQITAGAADPTSNLDRVGAGWTTELASRLAPPGDPLTGRARVQRVADVEREQVGWVWEGRLPAGKLTVLDGDPGTGKSTLTCDLAARVSTGSPMPQATRPSRREPAGVVLLTAEDDLGDTIRPRLEAAGADLTRIVVLRHVPGADGLHRLPSLPEDLDILERLLRREQAALLVVDPIMAFLSEATNSARDQDVRRALHPLAEMAAATGVAVLVVRHLTKGAVGNPLYRGGGSIGIIGAARVGLLAAPDPDDPDGRRRVLAVQKTNLAEPAPALAYRLVGDEEFGCGRIAWDGPTGHTPAQLLTVGDDPDGGYALSEAEAFLRELLVGGPVPAKQALAEARDAGVSERTLQRARKTLAVKATRAGQAGRRGGGQWHWTLPTDATNGRVGDHNMSQPTLPSGPPGGLNPPGGRGALNQPSNTAGPTPNASPGPSMAGLRPPRPADGALNLGSAAPRPARPQDVVDDPGGGTPVTDAEDPALDAAAAAIRDVFSHAGDATVTPDEAS